MCRGTHSDYNIIHPDSKLHTSVFKDILAFRSGPAPSIPSDGDRTDLMESNK